MDTPETAAQLAPGTTVGEVKDPIAPRGEAAPEEKPPLKSGDIVGSHFISKSRVFKTQSGKLEATPEEPAILLAAASGLKFDETQLDGLENISEFFAKINHVVE